MMRDGKMWRLQDGKEIGRMDRDDDHVQRYEGHDERQDDDEGRERNADAVRANNDAGREDDGR